MLTSRWIAGEFVASIGVDIGGILNLEEVETACSVCAIITIIAGTIGDICMKCIAVDVDVVDDV